MKHKQLAEPVACRYDFDGYGYLYMDAGSGSDWASRVKNCEPLYTHPMRELTDEKIIKIANKKITDDFYIPEHLDYLLIRFARAIIKASRGEK